MEIGVMEVTAEELFAGQDGDAGGDLRRGMFEVLMQRLSAMAGLVCRRFEYRRYEGAREATVVVEDNKSFNACLEYMEDSFPVIYTLDIDLVPVCKFILHREGEGDVRKLEIDANELSWSKLKSEIRFSIGKDFNVRPLERGDTTGGTFITTESSFDQVVDSLFDEVSRFEAHLLLVPSSSFCQLDVNSAEEESNDGRQDGQLSWEVNCLSGLHLQGYEEEKVSDMDIDNLPLIGSFAVKTDEKWGAICNKVRQIPWVLNSRSRAGFRSFLSFGAPPQNKVKEISNQKDWEDFKKLVLDDHFFDGKCFLILLRSSGTQDDLASKQRQAEQTLRSMQESDAAVKREPLTAFLLMCYEDDEDPIRLRMQVTGVDRPRPNGSNMLADQLAVGGVQGEAEQDLWRSCCPLLLEELRAGCLWLEGDGRRSDGCAARRSATSRAKTTGELRSTTCSGHGPSGWGMGLCTRRLSARRIVRSSSPTRQKHTRSGGRRRDT